MISNDKFLAANPEPARRLVRALQKAVDFSRANPEKALAIYFKANPEVRKELDKRAFELTLDQFATTQKQSREKWDRFNRFALKMGIIENSPPTDDLFQNMEYR